MEDLISSATRRNWEKLQVREVSGKLASRANKRLSQRQFMPLEYVSEKSNLPFLRGFLKLARLRQWAPEELLYTVAVRLLELKGLAEKPHVQAVLTEYPVTAIPEIQVLDFPATEADLLGLIYQALQTEGEKNRTGTYYTKTAITGRLVADLDFSGGQLLFDPCCGSGAFLLAARGAAPAQLVGMDVDPIAVMIAKCNLLLKFPEAEFIPQITCKDYLSEAYHSMEDRPRYDYIITNPPWGAVTAAVKLPEIKSRESFSYFLVYAYQQLKEQGWLRFLLPESVLNVKSHQDIRRFLLSHGSLRSITRFADNFSGVMTGYIALELTRKQSRERIRYRDDRQEYWIDSRFFGNTSHVVFSLLAEQEHRLIGKIRAAGRYSLKNSRWALGIVTGDNKKILKQAPFPGSEPIYTGKQIRPYTLMRPEHHLNFQRAALQQAARDELYRAPEKLVYRFISNSLIFAYDSSGSLFLNSANILIPEIPGMSIKTVMAFLNSELYQYLYAGLFGEVKVLKGNLQELLFPQITRQQNKQLTELADRVLAGEVTAHSSIQEFIYALFQITKEERLQIMEFGRKRRNRQCLE